MSWTKLKFENGELCLMADDYDDYEMPLGWPSAMTELWLHRKIV